VFLGTQIKIYFEKYQKANILLYLNQVKMDTMYHHGTFIYFGASFFDRFLRCKTPCSGLRL